MRRGEYGIFLSVEVTGTDPILVTHSAIDGEIRAKEVTLPTVLSAETRQTCLRRSNDYSSTEVCEYLYETVSLFGGISSAVYSNDGLIGSGTIPFAEGLHEITIPIGRNRPNWCTVSIDPENTLFEIDEANNSQSFEIAALNSPTNFSVSIQNPLEILSATVFLPNGCNEGINFAVYSVDGRQQSGNTTEPLPSGTHTINLSPGGDINGIPSGVYFIHMTIPGEDLVIRKVVLL